MEGTLRRFPLYLCFRSIERSCISGDEREFCSLYLRCMVQVLMERRSSCESAHNSWDNQLADTQSFRNREMSLTSWVTQVQGCLLIAIYGYCEYRSVNVARAMLAVGMYLNE
jgi:hypothetical protein